MRTDIYGLLGMIKDGKAPKKILFKEKPFEYVPEEKDYYFDNGLNKVTWLFDEYVITDILNDEIEILETTITYKQDDKIEPLEYEEIKMCNDDIVYGKIIKFDNEKLVQKINEIIDRLNEEE